MSLLADLVLLLGPGARLDARVVVPAGASCRVRGDVVRTPVFLDTDRRLRDYLDLQRDLWHQGFAQVCGDVVGFGFA